MELGDGRRRLLVWDAPSMDRCLAEVIGQRTSVATRPDLNAVLAWARTRSQSGPHLEACVFCTVPKGLEATMAPWVAKVRQGGFAVFAKPTPERNGVDADILRHIDRRFAHGSLVELVVAANDSPALAARLRRWAQAGVAVAVLGYRERAPHTATSPELTFVDLEDIPGAFARPLPRTNLFDLPAGGRWFDPLPADDPPAPVPVDREALLRLLESEVTDAVAAGAAGLTLRQVGDIVRVRFGRRPLGELGFASVGELVDALVGRGNLRLVRLDDGRHLLAGRTSAAAEPAGTAAEPAGTAGFPGAQDTDEPIDLTDTPNLADPDAGRAVTGAAGPAQGSDEDEHSPTRPNDTPVAHPIYRAFGVRRLA